MKNKLLAGRHPIMEAIEQKIELEKIFLFKNIQPDFRKVVMEYGRTFNVPVQMVPKEKLSRLYGGNHQGVVAVRSLVNYKSIEDIIPFLFENGETPLILLLDGITDVRNFGAIARSAACMGVHAVIIPKSGGAMINVDAIKTSAGALNQLPVCRVNKLSEAIEFLRNSGISIFGSALSAKEKVQEMEFDQPTCIVLGSEDKGMHPEIAKQCNQLFIIPHRGKFDSLNVSVSAGIMLYEVQRQRLGT